MSVADKLLQVNQVKQDIKDAIEDKGVDLSGVAFTDYAEKIGLIEGGGGGEVVEQSFAEKFVDVIKEVKQPDYYETYAGMIYDNGEVSKTTFETAWQDMKDSETVLFDIPLTLAAPNQEMEDFTIDMYVGTDGQLQALYDACDNGTIPPPIDSETRDVYYVNNIATYYWGNVSGEVDFPIPIYMFGHFLGNENTSFLIGDLTPLGMGLGLVLIKPVNVSIPNNNIVIQQGFEFENESGIIIPNSVTSIGTYAFYYWTSNNQPLVIPNSVTSIGNQAFQYWTSNNKPLVIPDSVTSIGSYAFNGWTSNNQPLVIPDSVTSIGSYAFADWQSNNQPLVIPNSITSIEQYAFDNWSSNNHPLVIPDSVTSIGSYAFADWQSNNQPLVIPNSVTSIGNYAFTKWLEVPYVEIQAITPPTLASSTAFAGQNNAPIYVPDESVDDYKIATNWVDLADRIFPISDKPDVIGDIKVVELTQAQYDALSAYDNNTYYLIVEE